MKRIGISQRVDHIHSYGEYRSALDQRWVDFAFALDYFPVPLPIVDPANIDALFMALNLDAVVLSGGNSLSVLDSKAEDASPKRDAFEHALLKGSLMRKIPIVGVCRGMQLLNNYFGGQLVRVDDHVAVRHALKSVDGSGNSDNHTLPEEVNSYHAWTIPPKGLASDFTPLAFDAEGNVEAFECVGKHVLGLMWHPERESLFVNEDINFIKAFLV